METERSTIKGPFGESLRRLRMERNISQLDNIRRRLKVMCGGTLELSQSEAGGTKVAVFVPLQKP